MGVATFTTATTAGMNFAMVVLSDRLARDHTLWNLSAQSAQNRPICRDGDRSVAHRGRGRRGAASWARASFLGQWRCLPPDGGDRAALRRCWYQRSFALNGGICGLWIVSQSITHSENHTFKIGQMVNLLSFNTIKIPWEIPVEP